MLRCLQMPQVRPLPAALQEVARHQLKEREDRLEEDITHIREWLKKQPHIYARTDDQSLVTFLRSTKHQVGRTKARLDSYYSLRTALPEFFSCRDPLAAPVAKVLDLGVVLPLPATDAHGHRVQLLRIGAYDAAQVNLSTVFTVQFLLCDLMVRDDDTAIVCGVVSVIDLAGVGAGHAAQIQPGIVKKAMTCFQQGYPLRPKAIHYINLPPAFEMVLNIFKTFMSEKLKGRIHIHTGGLTSLYTAVPKEILPEEYGGSAGTVKELTASTKQHVLQSRQYLLEDSQYRVDESKRLGDPLLLRDMWGMEGTFRRLTLD